MQHVALLALGAALLGAMFASETASAQGLIVEGEPFPEIAFPALEDGTAMSIRDFRGEKVVLHVFASW